MQMGAKKANFTSVEEWGKAYEELLAEKQVFYHHVLRLIQMIGDESDNYIYLYDTKKEVMVNCQKTANLLGVEEMLEKSPEELAMMDFVTDESKEEFAQLHRKMIEGANEAKGIIKLKQTHGVRAIYELKLKAYFDENGQNKEVCMATLRDITEGYLKGKQIERYLDLVSKRAKFAFTYQKNTDCFTIFVPQEARKPGLPDSDTHFFFSKLVKDEKVCRKADIMTLQNFLAKGTKKPIEIYMYDGYTESYRWYQMIGEYEKENDSILTGTIEDITDIKKDEVNESTLKAVLDCLGDEYILVMEIDLQQDTYHMLLGDYWRTGGTFPTEGCYTEANESIVRCVQPKYAKARKKFGDIKELRKVLREEKRIEYEYKVLGSKVHGRKAIIQMMEADEYGEPWKALLVHMCVEEKKKCTKKAEEKSNEEKVEEINLEEKEFVETKLQDNNEVKKTQEEKKNWKKVLLTEHYRLNAQFATEALEQVQLDACLVDTHEDALQRINESQEGEFSMVFLDMDTSQQDGYKTAKQIRKADRKDAKVIPIIALSVHDIDVMGEKAREAGINEALLKPLSVEQIEIIEKKYADFV